MPERSIVLPEPKLGLSWISYSPVAPKSPPKEFCVPTKLPVVKLPTTCNSPIVAPPDDNIDSMSVVEL